MSDSPEQPINTPNFDESERAAMRAYLQRAEVRLSTMHRIGGAFLSGAGLLVLLPLLFNAAIIESLFNKSIDLAWNAGGAYLWICILLFFLPPLAALYLLIKDIALFYFTANPPGFHMQHYYSRFILSSINFSFDESSVVRDQASVYATSVPFLDWILPDKSEEDKYFTFVLEATGEKIIEGFRSEVLNDMRKKKDEVNITRVKRLFAGMRLAGAEDRPLVEEVAKMELSLTRHALALRHLVLRYMKAFLLFIFTALTATVLSQSARIAERLPENIIFVDAASMYIMMLMVWAALCPLVVRLPIKWISIARQFTSRLPPVRDIALVKFENFVIAVCFIETILGMVFLGTVWQVEGGTIKLLYSVFVAWWVFMYYQYFAEGKQLLVSFRKSAEPTEDADRRIRQAGGSSVYVSQLASTIGQVAVTGLVLAVFYGCIKWVPLMIKENMPSLNDNTVLIASLLPTLIISLGLLQHLRELVGNNIATIVERIVGLLTGAKS